MYMLETNPGPGSGRSAGVLPVLQGQDPTSVRSRRGCHSPARRYPRDHFPYILMNPIIILAPIAGNFCAILFYTMTGAGLSGRHPPVRSLPTWRWRRVTPF